MAIEYLSRSSKKGLYGDKLQEYDNLQSDVDAVIHEDVNLFTTSAFADCINMDKYNQQLDHTVNAINNDVMSIQKYSEANKSSTFNMQCTFAIEEPFFLEDASTNFLTLLNMNSVQELKNTYSIASKLQNTSTKIELDKKVQKSLEEHYSSEVKFRDMFLVSNEVYHAIVSSLKVQDYNRDGLIRSGKIRLRTNTSTLNIKLLYELCISEDKKHLLMKFCIYKLILQPYTVIESTNTLYKELVDNFIMDVPFPVLVFNNKGAKFINKPTCDWFGISYEKIDRICRGEDTQMVLDQVFAPIDSDLYTQIKKVLTDSNSKGFYKEFILKNRKSKIPNSNVSFNNIPSEIFIQCIPFTTISNQREVIIYIQNASLLYSFMKARNSLKTDEHSISDHIHSLNKYNNFFKSFFSNTQTVAFGRIDVKSKDILVCNDQFESLLKYHTNRERYVKIVECIANEHHPEKFYDNFYTCDLIFGDKIISIFYTYNNSHADIIILQNFNESYETNCNVHLLKKLYDVSDLSIIMVNRQADIVFSNIQFKAEYGSHLKQISEHKQSSLLDLVSETDRRKVKRAISDAIKFNSCNLKDSLTMIDSNNEVTQCNLLCITTPGESKKEELISIIIFPNKSEHNEEKEDNVKI